MAPARAWGLLDLLDGGRAPWLSAAERSQVRARIRSAFSPSVAASPMNSVSPEDAARVGRWRAMFSNRSHVHLIAAHSAALRRLLDEEGVRQAGVAAAIRAGADLVDPGALLEVYVPARRWSDLVVRYRLRAERESPNVLVRVPHGVVDPFNGQEPGAAVLAADLLESAEHRVWRAGATMLAEIGAAPRRKQP